MVVLAIGLALAPAASADDWTQYKHDPGHTGSSDDETRIGPGNVADLVPTWTKRVRLGSNPLAVNGNVIVSGRTARERREGGWSVWALSVDTGSVVWRSTFRTGLPLAPEAITGGAIVLEGGTAALDVDTGVIRWIRRSATSMDGLAGAHGVVYGTFHRAETCVSLRAINARTGTVLWTAPVTCDDVLLQPRPSVSDGVVYVTRNYGVSGEAVIADSVIYFEGELLAYVADTGKSLGKDECGDSSEKLCGLSTDGTGYLWSSYLALNSWALDDGSLFGGCFEAAACAVHADNGEEIWRTPHESMGCESDPPTIYSDCKAIAANGVAYIYHPRGGLHAFDAATGDERLVLPETLGDPIVVDGALVTLVDVGVRAYQVPSP
jgi:outer membrane protein assembly factor BamB